MHIGLVSPAWPVDDFPNGIVTYVRNIRSELIEQGHRVSVFCNELGNCRDPGIYLARAPIGYRIRRRLSPLDRTRSFNFFNWGAVLAAEIAKVHRRQPLDVIEMDEFWGWCADVQAEVQVPVVVKLHGPAFLDLVDEERNTQRALARIEREGQGLHKMPVIIAPSRGTLDDTLHHYRLEPRVCEVVPNPVAFPHDDQSWDLDACDRGTVLFVGRFDKRKGGDTVLLAFRKLLERDAGLKLIFVGPDSGLTAGGGSAVHFAQFTSSLFADAQRQNIQYLGKVPPAEIPGIRRKAMLTIIASRWENQPNTVLEAMAQGCPVVAVDSGGVRETVEHGVTGLLARPGDIEDLCCQVMDLLADPVKARELGTRGRNAVRDRHSAKDLARQTINVYRKAIEPGGSLRALA